MRQTRRGSLLEVTGNLIVGSVISWLLTYFVLPWGWGLHPSPHGAVGIVALYTVASMVRQYALRRAFEWWKWRHV